MTANWNRCSASQSTLAPRSSTTTGRCRAGMTEAMAGRSIPGRVLSTNFAIAIRAPVLPAETAAAASPSFTALMASRMLELRPWRSAVRRLGVAGDRSPACGARRSPARALACPASSGSSRGAVAEQQEPQVRDSARAPARRRRPRCRAPRRRPSRRGAMVRLIGAARSAVATARPGHPSDGAARRGRRTRPPAGLGRRELGQRGGRLPARAGRDPAPGTAPRPGSRRDRASRPRSGSGSRPPGRSRPRSTSRWQSRLNRRSNSASTSAGTGSRVTTQRWLTSARSRPVTR